MPLTLTLWAKYVTDFLKEDEFFTVAQKFTVHLHAAEYKRQEKMVKARNAEAINSISRPVTGRMQDHTKRKVEGIGRAKAQRTTLQSLLGRIDNAEISEESDEGNGLPYVGTTLHGLMDSPRRRAASLVRIGSNQASTRAAAGFRKPAASSKLPEKAESESPLSKFAFRPSQNCGGSISDSLDDDDDLDASISAPKLTSLEQKDNCLAKLVPTSGSVVSASSLRQPSRSSTISKGRSFLPFRTSDEDSSRLSYMSNSYSRTRSDSSSRIAKRLEQARSLKVTQEQGEQTKKKLDIIPTFL